MNTLNKKDFPMKWVKQTIHYWCDDTRSKHCLGNGICAAILDTGISAHPDFSGRILDFQDFTSSPLSHFMMTVVMGLMLQASLPEAVRSLPVFMPVLHLIRIF
jgi:hypothetical protein